MLDFRAFLALRQLFVLVELPNGYDVGPPITLTKRKMNLGIDVSPKETIHERTSRTSRNSRLGVCRLPLGLAQAGGIILRDGRLRAVGAH